MRNPADIAATAALLGCACVYAAQSAAHPAYSDAWALEDAALARQVASLGDWMSGPLARCYAEQLSVRDGDSYAAQALACDGEMLTPGAG